MKFYDERHVKTGYREKRIASKGVSSATGFRCGDLVRSPAGGWHGIVDAICNGYVRCIVREPDGTEKTYSPLGEYLEMVAPFLVPGDRVRLMREGAKWEFGTIQDGPDHSSGLMDVLPDFHETVSLYFNHELERVHMAVPEEDPMKDCGTLLVNDGANGLPRTVGYLGTDKYRNVIVADADHIGEALVIGRSQIIPASEKALAPEKMKVKVGDRVAFLGFADDDDGEGLVVLDDDSDEGVLVQAAGEKQAYRIKVENIEIIESDEIPPDNYPTWTVVKALRSDRFWIKTPARTWHAISDGIDWPIFYARHMQ